MGQYFDDVCSLLIAVNVEGGILIHGWWRNWTNQNTNFAVYAQQNSYRIHNRPSMPQINLEIDLVEQLTCLSAILASDQGQ